MKVCKNVWLLVSLLCLFCACKEREHDRFTISGEMKGLPKGVVKLYTNPPGNVLLDSCEVKDGKYFLEGKITEPQAGLLFFDMEPQYQRLGASMVAIFIEPEDMKVYSELDEVKKTLKITSAPINEDIHRYNVYLKSLPEKQLVAEFNGKIQYHKVTLRRVIRILQSNTQTFIIRGTNSNIPNRPPKIRT